MSKNETKQDLIKRFLCKVKKTETCWEWIASNRHGYGQFCINFKVLRAHRVSYELFKGRIPEGLYICHACDNRKCVNPEHLWLGTPTDNIQDMIKKGRAKMYGRKGKLNEDKAEEIRQKLLNGTKYKELQKEYGVNRHSIYCIKINKSYKKEKNR